MTDQQEYDGPKRSKMIFGADGAGTPGAELTTAAYNGDIKLLDELLSTGFDVNSMDKRTGRNALHEACITGNEHVVRCLFKHGCNVHTRTMLGRESCLHLAAQHPRRKEKTKKWSKQWKEKIMKGGKPTKVLGSGIPQERLRKNSLWW